jgi:hypothetical protein
MPLAFDRETYADRLDVAIAMLDNPPDPATRDWITWGIAQDVEFWGPRVDPGGDQMRFDGTGVMFAGRSVPAVLHGKTLRLGRDDRLGHCVAYALLACGRLLHEHPEASGITFTLGRSYGMAQQSWTAFTAHGRRWVLDLTLAEAPFDEAAYMAAGHFTVGTRIPVPDLATLDALRELAEENETLRGSRADFLSRLSAAIERQKE